MANAICSGCIQDKYLREMVEDEGEQLECSECGELQDAAVTVETLGKLIEPFMREQFALGPTVKKFGPDDAEWWEQEGQPMRWAVEEMLGQYPDFMDEIVDAVVDAEDVWPPDGEEPFWDTASSYVEKRIQVGHLFAEWNFTQDELKHKRRFFSPAAKSLFDKLFEGVDTLKAWNGRKFLPVVRTLPIGTKFYRARICNSRTFLKDIYSAPLKHGGPPPQELARQGRMNAEGVVVLYGAREEQTSLAEMRPAIGNELAMIQLAATRPLRVLDFSRLDLARSGRILSRFQPDFIAQLETQAFLRRIHSLISQPIVPGKEADYVITQTLAEYLAHVHSNPFGGILFSSAQRRGGTNVVLFPASNILSESIPDVFGVAYLDSSLKLFSTTKISYKNREVDVNVGDDGDLLINSDFDDHFDDDWLD